MTVLCDHYEISDLLMSMSIRSNILQGPLGIRRCKKLEWRNLSFQNMKSSS